MKTAVRLSDLVISGEFLDGSALYHQKSVILLSVEKDQNDFSVKGMIKNLPSSKISFSADSDGKLVSKSCSAGCGGICKHVVALALLYNEMSVDDADPSEQLSRLKSISDESETDFPVKISIEKNEIKITHDPGDHQFKKIVETFENRNLAVMVSVFPEKFALGNVVLQKSSVPATLFYEIEKEHVRFFFPEHVLYFEPAGAAIDSETGNVHRFTSSINGTIATLLNISMGFNRLDDLVKAIADLTDNLRPLISLNGELNLDRIHLDDDTKVVFDIYFEKGKVCSDIVFISGNDRIEFRPKRKNYEQNYPANGKVYSLSPELIKKVRTALSSEGFRFSKNRYTTSMDRFSAILKEDSALNKVGTVISKKEVKKVQISEDVADKTEIVLDVNADEKWFSFNVKLPETASFITSSELVSAVMQYESGVEEPVVVDIDGNPVILEKSTGFLKKISALAYSDIFKLKEKIPAAHLLRILNSENRKILQSFTGDEESKNRYISIINSMSKGELPQIQPAEVSTIPMRQYQTDGYNWLMLLRELGLGGILADEMGLGKTLQALAMIKSESDDEASLVVCPKTLIWSWDREIQKFFPEMKRVIIDSLKPEERALRWKNATKELIITSYAVVINDFRYLKDRTFKTVVLDEAQHIKNNNTKRFKIISSIKSKYRFALTGTPIENHVSDLWSIFQFVMPGYLGSRKDVDKSEKNNDSEGLKRLSTLAAPFILRRTKSETLAELPELIVKEYPVEMTPKQKEIYLSVLLRGRAEFIEKGDSINKIEILSILSKLRLAANHPSFVSTTDTDPALSSKIPAILELTDEIIAGGGRVLIFSQYVKMLSVIVKAFEFEGRDYFYMDGNTDNRIDLVDRFNGGEKDVFLLSLKVGGVGLNLTGADNVIIVDPWWNPAVEEQAWSRAHRIGQEKKVVVNKLFSKGTIEERILDMHQKKRGMTDFFMSKSLKDPSVDFIKMLANMELSQVENN